MEYLSMRKETCRMVPVRRQRGASSHRQQRKYQGLAHENTNEKLWRITCFAVLKKYRKRGVTSTALKAAREAIRNKGSP